MERVARICGQRPTRTVRTGCSILVAAVAVCAACGGDGGGVPETLVDETRPPALPAQLDLDDAVMTSTHVLPGNASEAAGCVADVDARVPERIVERVGVVGRSLTFRARGIPRLYSCNASAGAREPRGEWCNVAVGRVRGGHLTDARLSVANCVDRDGSAVASAWLEPLPAARWLALEQDGYMEIYETGAGLPVRVATNRRVGEDGSSLRVRLAQYAADGSKLDQGEYELRVAG